ncbi:MAG: KAP family NTPase [Candidatus Marinimicrobia bacterium]|nr:KAP family NTPase [Candidatus Neomarinimicrobiota bacterium]
MADKNRIVIKYLSDVPTDNDLFGGHARIADSIANTISNDENGKSIALVGSWGTGKSTIIQLVKKKLITLAEDTLVFEFDTWAHRGDPLKRTFLEKLIDFFFEKDIPLKKKFWEDKRNELSRKLITTKTKRTPVLTGWGRVLSFSTLLLPVGIAFFAKSYDGILGQNQQGFTPGEWLGVILMSLPFAIAITKGIVGCFKDTGPYLMEESQVEDTVTLQTPEPTSIEFEEAFLLLMEQVHVETKSKIVLVIDNLDRVERDEAKLLWATMRSMISQEFDSNRKSTIPYVWLVVPFAEQSVRKWWGQEFQTNEDYLMERANANDRQVKIKNLEERNKYLADSFIEKTFDIVFSIPEPVLSRWVEFMKEKLSLAFSGLSEEEAYDIVRAYDHDKKSDNDLAPRKIVQFINRLGLSISQWQREIPIKDQVYHILFHEGPIKTFINEIPEQHKVQYLSEKYIHSLAALHFNIKPDNAIQALNYEAIRSAIQSGSLVDLEALAAFPGTDSLIDQVFENMLNEWIKSDPDIIGVAAYVLQAVEAIYEPRIRRWESQLQIALSQIDTFPILSQKGLIGYETLLSKDNTLAIENLIQVLSHVTVDDDGNLVDNLETWVQGTQNLITRLIAERGEDFRSKLVLGKTATDYLQIMSLLKEPEGTFCTDCLKPPSSDDEIVEALIKDIKSETVKLNYSTIINCLYQYNTEFDWSQFEAHLAERLNTSQMDANVVEAYMGCIDNFFRLGIIKWSTDTRLIEWVKGGNVYHFIQIAYEQKLDEITTLLLLVMRLDPRTNQGQNRGQSPAGRNTYATALNNKEILQGVVDLAESMGYAQEIIKTALSDANTISRNLIITAFCENEWSGGVFTSELFMVHYKYLNDLLDEDVYNRLIGALVKDSDLEEWIIEDGFDPDDIPLYLEILELGAFTSKPFLAFIKGYISTLEKSEWLEIIADDSQELHLISILIERGVNTVLRAPMRDAIMDRIEQHDIRQINIDKDEIDLLYNSLEGNQKKLLVKDIRDYLIESDGALMRVVDELPRDLFNCEIYKEKAEDIVRRMGRNIFERQEPAELDFFGRLVGTDCPQILKSIPKETKLDLKERVNSILDELGDDAPESVIGLKQTLSKWK